MANGGGSGVSGGLLSNPDLFWNNWTGGVNDIGGWVADTGNGFGNAIVSAAQNLLVWLFIGLLVLVIVFKVV